MSRTIVVSETQEPIVTGMLAPDHWERGLDPWHEDAFPDEHKHAGSKGERKGGWFGVDAFGNTVLWVADGTEIEVDNEPAV